MYFREITLLLIIIQSCDGGKIPSTIEKDDIDVPPSIKRVIEFTSYFLENIMKEEEEEKEELVVKKDEEKVTQYIKITSSIEIPETESIKLVMEAVRVLWRAVMAGLSRGFMPTLERVRRDADSSRGFILDWIIDVIGALIGRQQCSQKVACRAGRLAQEKVPGSQMLVVMMESFVPPGLLRWFSILKTGVMSAFDACDSSFLCDFTDITKH